MAASEDLKTLVNQLPDPDRRGMFCTDIDKAKIEQAIAAIHQGGKDNVLGLIDLLAGPGQPGDVKPHYALHCLGNHILQIKDEAARREFGQTLASQLGGEPSQGDPGLPLPGVAVVRARRGHRPPWARCSGDDDLSARPPWPWWPSAKGPPRRCGRRCPRRRARAS